MSEFTTLEIWRRSNVSLWAWEPQPNSEPFIIQLESQEVSMDAKTINLVEIGFEGLEEGLQVYFILNSDVDSTNSSRCRPDS